MKQRQGNLLVKEVILHKNPEPSSTFSTDKMDSNHKSATNNLENCQEDVHLGLTPLGKPPEYYFGGTKKKKETRRRKTKHQKGVTPPSELFCGCQTLSGEVSNVKQQTVSPTKSPTEEEKTEMTLLQQKIYEYEKTREQALRKNCMKQKKAEEDYICQLENMAAMWFEIKKNRCRGKYKKFKETTCSKKRNSLASGKYWKDNSGSTRTKKDCQFVQTKPAGRALGEEFWEKLVLVDEDGD